MSVMIVVWCDLQCGMSGETEESLSVLLSFDVESLPDKVMLGVYSGAKKYLVSHQLCKFSHLKR
jgi:hypothetical protein